ncbi:MAG: FtsW/RodA/SpoVE family cell cycle protein [Candidatus Campbellbacteria bacterium]|nr:FtsW/RodA/SpoVE family cell cycle protein [Candidatus Campbellbacteria bacterium]
MQRGIDKPFLFITSILVVAGMFIFISASIGLLARAENLNVSGQIINQLLSLGIGLALALLVFRFPVTFWHTYSFYILLAGLAATLLVLIPGFGPEHGGARRWIEIGSVSLQPAEFLKFAFILYFAAWCTGVRKRIHTFTYGPLALLLLLVPVGFVLWLQPDYGSITIIGATGMCMLIFAGARWKHIISLSLIGGVCALLVVLFVPYIQDRVDTFLHPGKDPLASGYQIKQSLIAIGSGQITGRGFGQSTQKFNFLPEPMGDSVFAVFAEEWGFVGGIVLIGLFIAFLNFGYRIALRAETAFSRLVVLGFVTAIVTQSFINMGSMLGVFPLTGDPLVFVSKGGTSLVFTLIEIGIILAISKHTKEPGTAKT